MLQSESGLCSSVWCLAEMASIFQRHIRERTLTVRQAQVLWRLFDEDLSNHVWNLLPVSDSLLRRVAVAIRTLPRAAFLRAGDAVHLISAREHGFSEIWTNDRRMLEAAPYFGLQGKS
jgi:predicted nucleic acid-binding protein